LAAQAPRGPPNNISAVDRLSHTRPRSDRPLLAEAV
jgi:hypothetical protein